MKKLTGVIFALFIVQAVSSQTLLKYRTPVKLKTENTLNSNHDDSARIVIAEEVRDTSGNFVLVASGTPVQCQVHKTKAKGIGEAGTIKIYPISVLSVDGQIILLDGQFILTGKNRKKQALVLGVGSGLTFLPGVGFCFLMLKGEQAVLPAGTIVEGFSVVNTYYINPE